MLKGFRFQKRLQVLPGVRINLSKSGASASVGPRGADVNIGPRGITTNAGIPGTGLSYRAKPGKTGSGLIGVVALVAGLGFAAYKNIDRIGGWLAPAPAAVSTPAPAAAAPSHARAPRAPLTPGLAYVHRGGAVLRQTEKTSGARLKKYDKGAQVMVIAVDGPWAQVKDGSLTGWMRSSTLGAQPPIK